MTRRKCDIIIFFLSIPFVFTLFKGWWSDLYSNWSSAAYPYLVLFAALAEIYYSRRNFVIAGMVGMGIFVLGLFLFMLHWPGQQLAVFMGLVIFTAVPIWNAITLQKQKSLRIIVSIWVLIYGIGVIFKVFHWPAGGLWMITSIAYIPIMATAIGINLWKSKQQEYDGNV